MPHRRTKIRVSGSEKNSELTHLNVRAHPFIEGLPNGGILSSLTPTLYNQHRAIGIAQGSLGDASQQQAGVAAYFPWRAFWT